MFALSALLGLEIYQVDVVTAYLFGELKELIYMILPLGLLFKGKRVVRLRNPLYGLKQSGHAWNRKLVTRLDELGFIQLVADLGIFIHRDSRSILSVYVDDMLLATKYPEFYAKFCNELRKSFEVEEMGITRSILGLRVRREIDGNGKVDGFTLDQEFYVQRVLEGLNMADCKPVPTPMAAGITLTSEGSPTNDAERELMNSRPYAQTVGKLLHLMRSTRPDIAYTVTTLAKFNAKPGHSHWNAVKHLLAYLQGTKSIGLKYTQSGGELAGFTDASFANDTEDRRSIGGYCFKLGGSSVSWAVERQKLVAQSTAEAEYIAMATCTKEALWMRNLLQELDGINTSKLYSTPIQIWADNQAAIILSKNPAHHKRTKHIDLRYHFLRQHVLEGTIKFEYVASGQQTADIFTKALGRELHKRHTTGLGLIDLRASNVGQSRSEGVATINNDNMAYLDDAKRSNVPK